MTDRDPLWLTRDQQVVWRAWLAAVARIDQALDAELRPHGLDLPEYEILVSLSEAPEQTLRMSDLADKVHQSRSRLTHTVARMEAEQLVVRRPCAADRRGVIAQLTQRGKDLLVTVAPAHVASVRRVFVDAVDPADYEALGRAMRAVLSLDEEAGATQSR